MSLSLVAEYFNFLNISPYFLDNGSETSRGRCDRQRRRHDQENPAGFGCSCAIPEREGGGARRQGVCGDGESRPDPGCQRLHQRPHPKCTGEYYVSATVCMHGN